MKYNNVAKKKEWEYSFFQKILKIVFSLVFIEIKSIALKMRIRLFGN